MHKINCTCSSSHRKTPSTNFCENKLTNHIFIICWFTRTPKMQFQLCQLDHRPRSRSSKNVTQTRQFRATLRSSVTQYYSGRGMERVHPEFYFGAHIRILAYYIRHLTYFALVPDFRLALVLLQCLMHRAILTNLFRHFHLWFTIIELTTLHG